LYPVLLRADLAPKVHLLKFEAPEVARKAGAGQFVVIRIDERGERIPLTIADWNRKEGNITIVFMEAGMTSSRLALVKVGDAVADVVGPLGRASEIDNFGTVVCVAGGFAVATIVPVARAMTEAGNKVISIMGARSRNLIFWEDELRRVSERLIVTTDDGSYGRKALVTGPLKELLEGKERIDRVVAIGPSIMMKFCAKTTEPFGVKTIVSLNPIMVDGTGMCGSCRVTVGGVTKLTCVDGPEFDGHQVDWEELFARQNVYRDEEERSVERWQSQMSRPPAG
jgi:ferredoxin--NADP+ reductase